MVKGKVKIMAKGKSKPPSRIKYERSHPTISCRVSMDTYKQLEKIKSKENKSFADILKVGMGILEAKAEQESAIEEKAFLEGYEEGYSEAKSEFRVSYRCDICGKVMTVNSEEERAAVAEYMKEHRWGHTKCHEREEGY